MSARRSPNDAAASTPSAALGGERPTRVRRLLRWVLIVPVGVFLLIQLVPYGRSHTNPPTTQEPRWNEPATRTLAVRACFDCHSNLTTWPWYSSVAPSSWLVQRDVDDGRSALNFSEWNKPQDGAGDVTEAVAKGSMPPWQYKLLHGKARLSKGDRQRLINGLAATLRSSPAPGG